MKKFINWLLQSSEDPNKLALTVKGGLSFIVTLLVTVHAFQSQDQLNPLVDAIVQFVSITATLISTGAMIAGFVRKLKVNPTVTPVELIPPQAK